ncbi:hypothetical protein Ahy_Scaffold1g106625 isoform A [Arachis hypogaea]|uniref:Phospholipase D n=1 Tax=Arachis hypogaea TaxID=3818 RepID=A0A444WQW0_ARAHY|nr:hypothetical protein Ahy_Scaffold1g106625 isoform A [Arachis hypogaea]
MAHLVYGETPSFGGSNHGQPHQFLPFPTSSSSLPIFLLHGNLEIWIHEAKNLPNMDTFSNKLGGMLSKLPMNLGGKIEGHVSQNLSTSDPYVTVSVSGAVIARSFVIRNSENPVWMQHFNVPVAHHAAEVHFVVKDSDYVGSQIIGAVGIPVERLIDGTKVEGVFPILNASGKPCKHGAVLNLSVQYTHVDKVALYGNGVGAGPNYEGVPDTYFPLRKGGRVTLYQDAHVHEGFLNNLDANYKHKSCWDDIFDAISEARRLVYVVGWSVYYNVSLIRGTRGDGKDCTLGELLKAKSQEGVRVLLLVWDDPTSNSFLGQKTVGLMDTHDEDTRHFFKHSSVRVLLCPRAGGKGHSLLKTQEAGTIYTHHQKTVIVDADIGHHKRKIVAFIGGLDLCGGRYDTPEHSLFRTLQTTHRDDFHNPNFKGPITGCPREPWHDLHSRIDGPAAYDILTNFEERWLRAIKMSKLQKMKSSYDDSLLKVDRIADIVGIDQVTSLNGEDNRETWHVQVFRSIDSNSVKGFPKEPIDAIRRNLVCGKNVMIDMSIHSAYVKAIRSAQKFIYIENQYFLGSSYNWDSHKDLDFFAGANNLIPMELALKIANKIKHHERFCVYIVIPMWPEGIPTGTTTQRILFWQFKTMQMMYETIYKALQEAGLDNEYEPQDYLNFFCLGNREIPENENIENPSGENTPQELTKKNRRFMIYVHSKGMIVDDEYVLLGSANINQRSMEGTRDTEIAMGAYQPHHTCTTNRSKPRGQVHGYRMSLWKENIGGVEACFEHPESLECVRRIRSLSEHNWRQYAADEVTEMKSHLLKYPVHVDSKGNVGSLPGWETFPDLGGNITGTFTLLQENLTI